MIKSEEILAKKGKLYYNGEKGGEPLQRLEQMVVTEVSNFLVVQSRKGVEEWTRNRMYYGLSFCRSGRIVYEKDGVFTLSDHTKAVFLPMGETYRLHREVPGEFPVINFLCEAEFQVRDILSVTLQNPDSYIREFEVMQELSMFRHNRLRVLGIFYGMLHRLVQETTEREGILKPVIGYLEQHYMDWDISNEKLAAQAGISEVYMRQLFRQQMGTSPKQYILELRVERAKMLLREGNMSVKEVAEGCGFVTSNHFCRMFRDVTGQTPGEYRRMSRQML